MEFLAGFGLILWLGKGLFFLLIFVTLLWLFSQLILLENSVFFSCFWSCFGADLGWVLGYSWGCFRVGIWGYFCSFLVVKTWSSWAENGTEVAALLVMLEASFSDFFVAFW